MNDYYLLGSQVLGADPRAVKEISFAPRAAIVGASAAEAPLTAQDKKDDRLVDMTMALMVGGALLGAVIGGKFLKSTTLGVVGGGIAGSFLLSAGGAYYLNRKQA